MLKSITKSLLLLIISSKTFSQENPLDPVSLSATLRPVKTSQTGRNIITVKGDQFENLPVHSIDELLRYVPGVEVQQRGPMGAQSDIVMRGGTFQQVLIILDGVRLNDPNTGHFNSYIPIAPAEIDRIEVLKGASSAIYGSEAVGGVIHIITKTFAANGPLEKYQFSAQGTAGEFGLVSTNLGGYYQNRKSAIGGGFLTNNSTGQPQRGTKGFFNNHTASLSFHHHINESWEFSLRSAYDDRNFSAQNFYTSFVSDTAEERVKSFWNQASIAYNKGNNKITLNLGYKQVKDRYAFNSAGTPNQNTSNLYQATTIYEKTFNTATSLITGGQFQNRSIESNDRGNHNINQAAAFVILNQSIGSYFTLAPALRVDYDERAGTELMPQINLSYRRGSFQLRGSAGKTIRQADFTERYNNYNKAMVTSGSIGNPNLVAERSLSYEAGADYFFESSLKVSVTGFRREQTNVIDWVNTPYSQMPRQDNLSPLGNYALASNIAEVNTTGIETDMQFTKKIDQKQEVRATLGLVWLDSETPNSVKSFYISSHANFLANFSLGYRFGRWGISTTAIYKDREPMHANAINVQVDARCFMLNAKADVNLIQNRLGIFIEVDNILDETCRDLLGSLKPARWIMGGVKLNINKD